jgi:hypothetical protein
MHMQCSSLLYELFVCLCFQDNQEHHQAWLQVRATTVDYHAVFHIVQGCNVHYVQSSFVTARAYGDVYDGVAVTCCTPSVALLYCQNASPYY